MMRNRFTACAAAAGIVTTMALVGASSAQGAAPNGGRGSEPTVCTSTLGDTTVYGDVVVPDGESCQLNGTTVVGRVRAGAGSDLTTVDAETGPVSLTNTGRFISTRGIITGGLTSTGSGLVGITGTAVLGTVRVTDNSDVTASGVIVFGDLVTDQVSSVRVSSASVYGSVRATAAANLASLCESAVSRNVEFRGNGGSVQVGGASFCLGNRVRGGVTVADSVGFSAIGDNIIRRDLNCTGNDPAPTGANNQVTGAKLGQCAGL